jgi:hypothetical protein
MQPSVHDIQTWCRACDAEDQAIDLIAAQRTPDSIRIMEGDNAPLWRARVTLAIPGRILVRHYGPYTTWDAALDMINRLRSWASHQGPRVTVAAEIQQGSVRWVSSPTAPPLTGPPTNVVGRRRSVPMGRGC